MPTRPRAHSPAADPRIAPERVLAMAVLRAALADTRSAVPARRADAVEFLAGGPDLSLWLDILGCEERAVRSLIEKALNGNGRGPKRTKTP